MQCLAHLLDVYKQDNQYLNEMSVIIPNLKVSKAKEDELIRFANNKVEKLTGNVKYPLPFPELDDVSALIEPYTHALVKSINGTKADTKHKLDLREDLQDALTYLAWECSKRAKRDRTMFLESGFAIKENGNGLGLLEAPAKLKAKEGADDNSILLKWKAMPKADAFIVQNSENGEDWKDLGFPTSSHFLASKLKRGKEYFFRIAAITPAGKSLWSDAVARIVV